MTSRFHWVPGAVALLLAGGGMWSCGEGTSGTGEGVFESANPNSGSDASRGLNSDGAVSGTGGGTGAPSEDAGGGDAARAIEEADIIKLQGDRLYALSRYGGLSVIDVEDTDQLRLLGRHKVVAQPFEMYVRDGIVFSLYQGYGEYVYDEQTDTTAWVQTSRVVIIDARSPEQMTVLDQFDVPGYISDSRIVGDILYVASFEDGYCWGCRENAPRTSVISLDVGDPSDVHKVDELSFDENTNEYSWQRSLSATDERLYIAGPVWGPDQPTGSTIQVIDISDPAGSLVQGAEVTVQGQIDSRWQMDEYDGVLRVISQPFEWNLTVPPHVETFRVVSSDELTPLGETALALPRPERLQSVRFDAERGYAITFQQTDPLFTIDLSDPEQPAQAGVLEMPGWIYYMEPRGDRLLGLGFDQESAEGSLHVSLFDVSDLSNPVMLDRANFGGDWGWMVEDQDRIHKAFNVVDAEGLILMPFSGWQDNAEQGQGDAELCYYGNWVSGVQLIDWTGDSLETRGVAPARGEARRGFLHRNRLFAVSDERVEVFDVSDRDAPAPTSSVALAQNVTETAGADGKVVRVGQNWYSQSTELDVTTMNTVGTPSAAAKIEIFDQNDQSCYSSRWLSGVFADAERAYLLYEAYDYDPNSGDSTSTTGITAVDVEDTAEPALLGSATLDFAPGYGSWSYELGTTGQSVLRIGSTFVFHQRAVDYNGDTPRVTESGIRVVDVSDIDDPKDTAVSLPDGLGVSGLVASGNVVARSHYERSPIDPERVRFYVDRVDVTNPERPVRLPSVNVPGVVVALDAESGHAFTLDYRAVVERGISNRECNETYGSGDFTPDGNQTSYDYENTPGTCRAVLQSLHLIALGDDRAEIIGGMELGANERVGSLAMGDDRLFVQVSNGYGYGYAVDCLDCGYGFVASAAPLPILVLGGLQSGDFEQGRIELDSGDYWGYAPIAAAGERAVVSTGYRGSLTVLDASDMTRPQVVREVPIDGYVQHLTVIDDMGVASLGFDGVATIPLSD